jgi:hypothetical protein
MFTNIRIKVPVNVAFGLKLISFEGLEKNNVIPMQEPRARIVSRPSYHHLLPGVASTYHIAANWVHIIEGTVNDCALYDIEGVLIITISTNQTCHRNQDELTP